MIGRDSKPPGAPGILFAIDVSYPMVKEGILQLICQNMKVWRAMAVLGESRSASGSHQGDCSNPDPLPDP